MLSSVASLLALTLLHLLGERDLSMVEATAIMIFYLFTHPNLAVTGFVVGAL
jgi:hypothetical protein